MWAGVDPNMAQNGPFFEMVRIGSHKEATKTFDPHGKLLNCTNWSKINIQKLSYFIVTVWEKKIEENSIYGVKLP